MRILPYNFMDILFEIRNKYKKFLSRDNGITKQLKFHKQYENWIYIQRDSSTACYVEERDGGIVSKEG